MYVQSCTEGQSVRPSGPSDSQVDICTVLYYISTEGQSVRPSGPSDSQVDMCTVCHVLQ